MVDLPHKLAEAKMLVELLSDVLDELTFAEITRLELADVAVHVERWRARLR